MNDKLNYAIKAALCDLSSTLQEVFDEERRATFCNLFETATEQGADLEDYREDYELYKAPDPYKRD